MIIVQIISLMILTALFIAPIAMLPMAVICWMIYGSTGWIISLVAIVIMFIGNHIYTKSP